MAILATGTSIAQLAPIVASPVLTRIYSPEDFGILAVFIGAVSILGPIATARYELAVLLPEDDSEALAVAAVGMVITTGTALVVGLLALLLVLADLGGSLDLWILAVPIVVWLTGCFTLLSYLANRSQHYAQLSRSYVLKSLAMVAVQVGVGFVKPGSSGLLLGQLVGSGAGMAGLAKTVSGALQEAERPTRVDLVTAARRYRRFPTLSLPANVANVASTHLTNMLIPMVTSIATLGLYSMVQRLMGLPTAVVGNSVGQVFFQEAALAKRTIGNSRLVFRRTVVRMTLLALPVFSVAFIVSPWAFGFAFGPEWRQAGEYAQILCPFFAVRFVVSTVSTTTSIYERQGVALAWQLVLLFVMLGPLIVCHYWSQSFEIYLALISMMGSTHYLLLLAIMWRMSKGGRGDN